jgi:hypothetical protein
MCPGKLLKAFRKKSILYAFQGRRFLFILEVKYSFETLLI